MRPQRKQIQIQHTSTNSAMYLIKVNHMHDSRFLGAFTKLEKVTISFVIFSVCRSLYPSTWNDSDPTETIFMKFDIRVFSKFPQQFQFLLNS